jgi:D-alanine-D-alanine ligase
VDKIRVGVFFGGRSPEHEVSVVSAAHVVANLCRNKYEVVLIGVSRTGRLCRNEHDIRKNCIGAEMVINAKGHRTEESKEAGQEDLGEFSCGGIDVAFPLLHGPFGEDGTIQGLFRQVDLPYVGASVKGSAICMDKDVTKRLLRESGILTARHCSFYRHEMNSIRYKDVSNQLGDVLFVKPANQGSSVGISKVARSEDFVSAVQNAFHYDNKILIEEYIRGREIECSVLGNEQPEASVPGEIVLRSGFYSYSAKYLNEDEAELKIPADLPESVVNRIQEIAVKAFQILCCEGMARVDFFVQNNSAIYLNEVNTIPGFTKISMYPKLWMESGLSYGDLLNRLISLAMSRHRRDSAISNICAELSNSRDAVA